MKTDWFFSRSLYQPRESLLAALANCYAQHYWYAMYGHRVCVLVTSNKHVKVRAVVDGDEYPRFKKLAHEYSCTR
jgi:hypothetical protein